MAERLGLMGIRPSVEMKSRSGVTVNGPLRCQVCGQKFKVLGRNANGQMVCAKDDPKANEFMVPSDAEEADPAAAAG